MANFKLPFFGTIDSEVLEEYYDVETDFNGTSIQIDLNFGTKSIDIKKLESVKNFIENIRIHDINNKKIIATDYEDEDCDTVKVYVEHHLEELGEDELADLIGSNSKSEDHEKLLLKKLHLVRVGIFPEGEDQFATFDYSIGQDITDQLVVIDTDENGNLVYITMEN
ncbi:MAG: DUF2004 domain-containing protein [Ferruginibacter sp.]